MVGDVAGRTCIIQDDIIDTAGTIVKAAHALKDNGAERVIACAVHGVLSGPAIERIEAAPIEQVIITNTIPLTASARGAARRSAAVGRRGCSARRSGASTRRRRSRRCSSSGDQAALLCIARSSQSRPSAARGAEARRKRQAMDATLEASKRDGRGKNEARRLRASGRIPAVLYGAEKGKARRDRRRSEGAVEDPALRVWRQHAHRPRGARRRPRRACSSRNTCSIRSTTSCSTPTSTGSRWTGRSP